MKLCPIVAQMELRSQDQALIRQLMELHSGIQELKQELSEEEETDEDEEEDEEGACYWDSESDGGSGSICCSPRETGTSFLNVRPRRYTSFSSKKRFSRRSSVPWERLLLQHLSAAVHLKKQTRWSQIFGTFPPINDPMILLFSIAGETNVKGQIKKYLKIKFE